MIAVAGLFQIDLLAIETRTLLISSRPQVVA